MWRSTVLYWAFPSVRVPWQTLWVLSKICWHGQLYCGSVDDDGKTLYSVGTRRSSRTPSKPSLSCRKLENKSKFSPGKFGLGGHWYYIVGNLPLINNGKWILLGTLPASADNGTLEWMVFGPFAVLLLKHPFTEVEQMYQFISKPTFTDIIVKNTFGFTVLYWYSLQCY